MLVDAARAAIASGLGAEPQDGVAWVTAAAAIARASKRQLLGPVINATGVLLHTNLGRAPLPPRATSIDDPTDSAIRYSNVELDLRSGDRGSRRSLAEPLLQSLTGAEATLVVNNCAAAVMLVLAALATGRGVAISRGELVEIGGGFRIPEVLAQSGAQMIEVGTTNRTRLEDYQRAHSNHADDLALVLKVHQSNYRIIGFTEEVSVAMLATLGLPVVADVGSGLLDTSTPWLADRSGRVPPLPWLQGEPGVRQTLAEGADLVVFSGDKLLGGPQSGVIAGRRELVEHCARHPLARALRPGALVLASLQDTLLRYAQGEARDIPFWRMATTPVELLDSRAAAIVAAVGHSRVSARRTLAVPGGGTLPDRTIESAGIVIDGDVSTALRDAPTPIVAHIHDGSTVLDLRTIDPSDDIEITAGIANAIAHAVPRRRAP